MADGITYGIDFPFRDSNRGNYLRVTQFESEEVKADLIHLLLTRKGMRYYLPDFGTRLYEYIFEPMDGLTFDAIESDIREAVGKYMPNLLINKITIEPADITDESTKISNPKTDAATEEMWSLYRVPAKGTADYTAKIKIDYATNQSTFAQSDFVIINI